MLNDLRPTFSPLRQDAGPQRPVVKVPPPHQDAGPQRPVVKTPPLRSAALFSAGNVLAVFTAQFIVFLWLDYIGAKPYPHYFTVVYLAVLAGVSLSNLLRRSRWFM